MTVPVEIRTLRGNMWSAIATRLHRPMGVFPFDQAANEVMIYGNVDMGLKNGKKVDNVEWSARMVFAQGSKDVKMEFYQVRALPKHLSLVADPTYRSIW